jgi:hypothetical protein
MTTKNNGGLPLHPQHEYQLHGGYILYIHSHDHLPLEFVLALSLLGELPRPRGIDGLSRLASRDFDLLFMDSICSSASTTSFMDGRLLGSLDRHLRVS